LLANVEKGIVFEREEKVKWICRNCGYIHEGKKALLIVPLEHPMAYFEIQAENY
jgi:rubrerythrin